MSEQNEYQSPRDFLEGGPRDISRLKVLKGQYLTELPPPEMLVADLIPAKSVIGLTADAGTGKSWWAMDLARALVEGGTFMGRAVLKTGPILYVGFDSSEHDYGRQFRRITYKWEEEITQQDGEPDEEFTHRVLSRKGETTRLRDMANWLIHPENLMLDNPEHIADLIDQVLALNQQHSDGLEPVHVQNEETGEWEEQAVKVGVPLIIADTFSTGIGGNFLLPAIQCSVLKNMRVVAEETGASVLILHHNAAAGEHRSSANWAGGVFGRMGLDVWFHLEKKAGDNNRKIIEVQVEKFRGISPKNFRFTLDVADSQRADLLIETDEERSHRVIAKAQKDAQREAQKEASESEVLNRLRSLGPHFQRSAADLILKQHLPGWGKRSGKTLTNRTRDWLAAHPMIDSAEDGKALTYTVRADGNGSGEAT